MRLFEALHQLTERFAPMSEKSSIDLQSQSSQSYMKTLEEVEDIDKIKDENRRIELAFDHAKTDAEKESLTAQLKDVPVEKMEHKLVRIAEKWWVRYLISALFVWVQPKIQNYLNPPPPVEQEYDED